MIKKFYNFFLDEISLKNLEAKGTFTGKEIKFILKESIEEPGYK